MILKKSADFRSVFQNGHSIKNEYFSIYFVKRNDLKVGFAAAKKCANKPMRNKLKRIARELWRTNHIRYSLSAHIVIIASKRNLAVRHNKREEAFVKLLAALNEKIDADVSTE